MKLLSSLALAAMSLSFLASAPALAQDADATTTVDPAAEPPSCVRLRAINGYSIIDEAHVLLNGVGRRYYLVTTRVPCPQLRSGFQMVTSFGANERVCKPFIEYITVVGEPRCSVGLIEQVESPEAARALVETRAALEAEEDSQSSD